MYVYTYIHLKKTRTKEFVQLHYMSSSSGNKKKEKGNIHFTSADKIPNAPYDFNFWHFIWIISK